MDSTVKPGALHAGCVVTPREGARWRGDVRPGLPPGTCGAAWPGGRWRLWAGGLRPPARSVAGPGWRRAARGGLRDGDPSPGRMEPDLPSEPDEPPDADPMPEEPEPEAPQPMDLPPEEEPPSWLPGEPELPEPDPGLSAAGG